MYSTDGELDVCHEIYKIYYIYVERILNSSGVVLNLMCVLVFMRIIMSKKLNGNMYNYLTFKSAFDAICSFRYILYIFYDFKYFKLNRSLVCMYFYWVFLVYFGELSQFMGILCEVAACFDRFKIVSNKLMVASTAGVLKKRMFKNYKFVLSIMFLACSILYSYKLFERKLVVRKIDNQTSEYTLLFNSFGNSEASVIMDFVNSILMNFMSIIIILVLNVLTLRNTKKCLVKKKTLIKNSNNNTNNNNNTLVNNYSQANLSQASFKSRNGLNNKSTKISRVEMNVSLMVFSTGLIALFGHGLVFIYRLPLMALNANFCFYSFAMCIFTVSYVCNFIIYFLFLKNFRNCCLYFLMSIKTLIMNYYNRTNIRQSPNNNNDVVFTNSNNNSKQLNGSSHSAAGQQANNELNGVRYYNGPNNRIIIII